MKFFNKIFNFVKKAVRKIAELFKDKNPVDVINDAAKTAAGLGTTALIAYGTVNSIRVSMMTPNKKKQSNNNHKSPAELVMEDRDGTCIDVKMARMNARTKNMFKETKEEPTSKIPARDLEALEALAKTRNVYFQYLSPEDQLEVLETEEFDFRKYADDYNKEHSKNPFTRFMFKVKKLGVTPDDAPFREPIDFGWANFFMHPLDDFIHWFRNDPVPKKVPQIHLVDRPEYPDIECDTFTEMHEILTYLEPYFSHNKPLAGSDDITLQKLEETDILASEVFKHDTLEEFSKAVNEKMAESKYNRPKMMYMLDDIDLDKEKKKKKKKKDKAKSEKKKNKKKKKAAYGGDSFSKYLETPPKKVKGLSKEEEKMMTKAEKKAQEMYNWHLEQAMHGIYDRKGYKYGF